MSRRDWITWIAVMLGVAVLVHIGAIYALPRIITARAMMRMGSPNAMHFGRRPSETSRAVVRPSPDILYSTCPFDLSKGPLRITARVPHSTYWSVSAFDARTNNFFVRNDQQIAGDKIEIIALRPGMTAPPADTASERVIVFAPTDKGLFLFRLLIDDEEHVAALDAIRHQASCETLGRQSVRASAARIRGAATFSARRYAGRRRARVSRFARTNIPDTRAAPFRYAHRGSAPASWDDARNRRT